MVVSTDVETLTPGQLAAATKKKSKKIKEGKGKDSAEKSSKKKRKTAEAAATVTSDEQPKKKKKKSKKETVHSSSDSEDTTIAGAAPVAAVATAAAAPAQPAKPANPLALDNFRLSAPIKSLLRAKNMDTLYDIQAQTLNFCLDGFDLVGRARTGTGKTLAFVLPIIERLSRGHDGSKRAFGRGPKVIVLAPTRELAKQVTLESACLSSARNLCVLSNLSSNLHKHSCHLTKLLWSALQLYSKLSQSQSCSSVPCTKQNMS